MSSIADVLKKDCGDFIREAGGKMLWRGMRLTAENTHGYKLTSDENIDYWLRLTRKDRKPADTSPELHQELDTWFDDKFGFKARSQSMFCYGTGGKSSADQYGNVYMVFPFDGYKFVWSPEVRDLYDEIGNAPQGGHDFDKDEWHKAISKFMEKQNYTDKELYIAAKSKSEIMVNCTRYYAIAGKYATQLNRILAS